MSTIHDSDYMDMDIGMAYRFLDTKSVLTELHDHNYYEYFIVTSGNISHAVNGTVQNLKTGDIVFIRPHDTHKYNIEDDDDFKLINISFCTKYFDEIASFFRNPVVDLLLGADESPIIAIPATQLTALKKKHALLNVSHNKSNLITQLKTLLVDVISLFVLEYEHQSQLDSRKWLQNVLMQMNTPENIEEGLPALIRLSGFSHGHLCRIMKNELGMTPTKYVTDLRLQYAANLLSSTDYDVLSIAVRLGFSSLSHFVTIFKEKYGLTPSKYRSRYANIYRW